MSESRPDPFVGRTIDGYRIDEVIGRGGMGDVYKATQLSLGRPVAVKILSLDLAGDPQFLNRFHREADALSRLSHPNIVTVFDRGEVDGRPYLAMEYVEGPSLREIIRGGAMAPQDALRIVSSVLVALQHAHDKGVVHRDIKPENVLLAKGDVVKVADFGLSRLLGPQEETRLTRTQLMLGTYEYMAPEQREHVKEADERSDLYSTGVVLYEMLTGELPIGRFDLPSRFRPGECDGRIDRLVERSLEKNPGQRYQSAGEMADAVSQVLDRPSAAEPPPPPPSFDPGSGYRPARFEHHIDNLATIDHVLGTLCYVLGFIALFGGLRGLGALPFVAFFVVGWYTREAATGLRKYKLSARTSQAVIAILAAFTGILLPFSVYSFWVLFGHRGRTYYEARGRGLDERAAARHTHRVVDEPFGPVASAPTPPPRPLRPSQIPVQSLVTSEVTEGPRRSRLVAAGNWVVGLTMLAGGLYVASWPDGFTHDYAVRHLWPLMVPGTAGTALLVAGLLHAIFSPRRTGILAALVGLVLAGFGFAMAAAILS